MKKYPSTRLDLQTSERVGKTLMQVHRLPFLISREQLRARQGEMWGWWQGWHDYLKKRYDLKIIWLELLDESGRTLKIFDAPENVNIGKTGTFQRFPLTVHDGILGWLHVVGDVVSPKLKIELIELLPLMGQGLFQELERTRLQLVNQALADQHDGVFESLAHILGLRDHETESHTMRVSRLAMRLVEHLQIPSNQWGAIRRGALLHDIGKLGIPDAILLKPGSLSTMERRMMELHVTYGHNILSSITNARQTLDIVLHHHERWDGTGYPDRLQMEQIPLVARLFAVVDVYDALTSDRPYRTAWLPERVLEYLKDQSGKHFDPAMVTAFIEVIRKESGN